MLAPVTLLAWSWSSGASLVKCADVLIITTAMATFRKRRVHASIVVALLCYWKE